MDCNACGGELRKDGRPRGRQRWKCRVCGASRYETKPQEDRECAGDDCTEIISATEHPRRRYHSDECARLTENRRENERRKAPAIRKRRNATRAALKGGKPPPCKVCGGPLARQSRTGVCTRNPDCKYINRSVHDQAYHDKKKKERAQQRREREAREGTWQKWEIPEAHEIDEDCEDCTGDRSCGGHDIIIDHIAVDVAARGQRHVRLSPTEQQMVLIRMLRWHCNWKKMYEHLGVGTERVKEILGGMGFEVVSDPDSHITKQRCIVVRRDTS